MQLGAALVEGIFAAVGVISWWIAIPIGALIVAFYWYAGRTSTSYTVRQASWTLALSQVLVALVPIVFAILGFVALAVVGVLAIVVLAALFAERP